MKSLKYSELQVGDIVKDYTAHHRVYTKTITRVNFTHTFNHPLHGEYTVEAFEYECEGKKYIQQHKSKMMPTLSDSFSSNRHSVMRNGEYILNRIIDIPL